MIGALGYSQAFWLVKERLPRYVRRVSSKFRLEGCLCALFALEIKC